MKIKVGSGSILILRICNLNCLCSSSFLSSSGAGAFLTASVVHVVIWTFKSSWKSFCLLFSEQCFYFLHFFLLFGRTLTFVSFLLISSQCFSFSISVSLLLNVRSWLLRPQLGIHRISRGADFRREDIRPGGIIRPFLFPISVQMRYWYRIWMPDIKLDTYSKKPAAYPAECAVARKSSFAAKH